MAVQVELTATNARTPTLTVTSGGARLPTIRATRFTGVVMAVVAVAVISGGSTGSLIGTAVVGTATVGGSTTSTTTASVGTAVVGTSTLSA